MKKFLAVLVAVVMMASFSSVSWAYSFSSVADVYELNDFCTKIGDEYRYEVNIARYLETHTVTEEEKHKIFDSYNAYRSALEDSSKTIMVFSRNRSASYSGPRSLLLYICNTSDLTRSVRSPYCIFYPSYYKLLIEWDTNFDNVSLTGWLESSSAGRIESYSGYIFFFKIRFTLRMIILLIQFMR